MARPKINKRFSIGYSAVTTDKKQVAAVKRLFNMDKRTNVIETRDVSIIHHFQDNRTVLWSDGYISTCSGLKVEQYKSVKCLSETAENLILSIQASNSWGTTKEVYQFLTQVDSIVGSKIYNSAEYDESVTEKLEVIIVKMLDGSISEILMDRGFYRNSSLAGDFSLYGQSTYSMQAFLTISDYLKAA